MYISEDHLQIWFLCRFQEGISFMARFLLHESPDSWRKGRTVFLALSFLAGLVSGILVFFVAGESILSLMRSALYCPVSIVGLLCVTALPFLFSAIAVFLSEPWLMGPISFGKAFFFSLLSLGTMAGFGSAGWLVRWLLMFSDLMGLPLLYLYWQRHVSGMQAFSLMEAFVFASLFVLIGSIDYCLFSPLLAGLIHF